MKKDQEIIKQKNIKIFLTALLENRPISRIDLAKITNISPTSITRISSLLISKGFVTETDSFSKGVGRHAVMLDTVSYSAYSLGIEIKRNCLRYSVIDLHKDCIACKSIDYDVKNSGIDNLVSFIWESAKEFLKENQIKKEKLIGVCLCIPGIVDNFTGNVKFSSQLGWKNVNICKQLYELFQKPIIAENDSKARIIGEKTLNNIPPNVDCALVIIGSGVSAAALSKGNIVRGFDNAAGEIGHLIIEPNGIECDCKSKGCLQTRLADKFLIKAAKEFDDNVNSVADIIQSYNEGKSWAKDIIEKFKYSFTLALDILDGCYNPEVILVSGHMADEMRPFLSQCAEKFTSERKRNVNVIIAANKRNVTAIGGAVIAFDKFITNLIEEI